MRLARVRLVGVAPKEAGPPRLVSRSLGRPERARLVGGAGRGWAGRQPSSLRGSAQRLAAEVVSGEGVAPEVAVRRASVLVGSCGRSLVIQGGAAALGVLLSPLLQPWRKAVSPRGRRRGRGTRPQWGTGQRGRAVPPRQAAEST